MLGRVSELSEETRRRTFLPSASMMKICDNPPTRSEAKTIDLPSGDQDGQPSCALSLVRRVTFVPSAAMR